MDFRFSTAIDLERRRNPNFGDFGTLFIVFPFLFTPCFLPLGVEVRILVHSAKIGTIDVFYRLSPPEGFAITKPSLDHSRPSSHGPCLTVLELPSLE